MAEVTGFGFQLYSAREFPPLGDQLRLLADLGYRYVEPYGGLFEQLDELQAGLAATGLTAPTCHIGIDRLRAEPHAACDDLQAIGTKIAIVPWIGPEARSGGADGWRRLGEELAKLQALLRGRGLELAWHNHDFEFATLADGSRPLELLLAAAPELPWEADLAWIARAGEDPVVWLERYADRIVAAHIKDMTGDPTGPEDGWADVGHGIMDWPRILPALRASSARYWVAEHDRPSDAARSARRSSARIQGWGAGR